MTLNRLSSAYTAKPEVALAQGRDVDTYRAPTLLIVFGNICDLVARTVSQQDGTAILLALTELPTCDDVGWKTIENAVQTLLMRFPHEDQKAAGRFELVFASDSEFSPNKVTDFLRDFSTFSRWSVRATLLIAAAQPFWPWNEEKAGVCSVKDLITRGEQLVPDSENPNLSWAGTLILGAGTPAGPFPRDADARLLARALQFADHRYFPDWVVRVLSRPKCIDDLFTEHPTRVGLLGISTQACPTAGWSEAITRACAAYLVGGVRTHKRTSHVVSEGTGMSSGLHSEHWISETLSLLRRRARVILQPSKSKPLQLRCKELAQKLGNRAELRQSWKKQLDEDFRHREELFRSGIEEKCATLFATRGFEDCREFVDLERLRLHDLGRRYRSGTPQVRAKRRQADLEVSNLLADGCLQRLGVPCGSQIVAWRRLRRWLRKTLRAAFRLLEYEAECVLHNSLVTMIDNQLNYLTETSNRVGRFENRLGNVEKELHRQLEHDLKPELPSDISAVSSKDLDVLVRETLGPMGAKNLIVWEPEMMWRLTSDELITEMMTVARAHLETNKHVFQDLQTRIATYHAERVRPLMLQMASPTNVPVEPITQACLLDEGAGRNSLPPLIGMHNETLPVASLAVITIVDTTGAD